MPLTAAEIEAITVKGGDIAWWLVCNKFIITSPELFEEVPKLARIILDIYVEDHIWSSCKDTVLRKELEFNLKVYLKRNFTFLTFLEAKFHMGNRVFKFLKNVHFIITHMDFVKLVSKGYTPLLLMYLKKNPTAYNPNATDEMGNTIISKLESTDLIFKFLSIYVFDMRKRANTDLKYENYVFNHYLTNLEGKYWVQYKTLSSLSMEDNANHLLATGFDPTKEGRDGSGKRYPSLAESDPHNYFVVEYNLKKDRHQLLHTIRTRY